MPEEEILNKEVKELDLDIDMLSKVTFMDSLLDKQTEIRNMLDVRSNIVIGFNSALIVLLVSYFKETMLNTPLLWLMMAILITSLLLAIVALKPPHVHTKKGQKESLFYHHYIASKDLDSYKKEIHGVLENKKEIFDAYITETYNLTCFSNIPRKMYLYSSIRVLIYGIVFVVAIYGLILLFNFLT